MEPIKPKDTWITPQLIRLNEGKVATGTSSGGAEKYVTLTNFTNASVICKTAKTSFSNTSYDGGTSFSTDTITTGQTCS